MAHLDGVDEAAEHGRAHTRRAGVVAVPDVLVLWGVLLGTSAIEPSGRLGLGILGRDPSSRRPRSRHCTGRARAASVLQALGFDRPTM